MQVKAGVKDAFRKGPDRAMVKAGVKVRVKAIQKCLLNCTPGRRPDPLRDPGPAVGKGPLGTVCWQTRNCFRSPAVREAVGL